VKPNGYTVTSTGAGASEFARRQTMVTAFNSTNNQAIALRGVVMAAHAVAYKCPREPSYFFLPSYLVLRSNPSSLHPYSVLRSNINKMGSTRPVLPKQTQEELIRLSQEQADENARAIRSSMAAQQASGDNALPYNHIGQPNLQIPVNAIEGANMTMMQQQPGMTAPAGLNIDWTGFTGQALADPSSYTTPTVDFDSPGK